MLHYPSPIWSALPSHVLHHPSPIWSALPSHVLHHPSPIWSALPSHVLHHPSPTWSTLPLYYLAPAFTPADSLRLPWQVLPWPISSESQGFVHPHHTFSAFPWLLLVWFPLMGFPITIKFTTTNIPAVYYPFLSYYLPPLCMLKWRQSLYIQ